jgi:hypothetical protein
MPDPHRDEKRPASGTADSVEKRDEPREEEEKIMAGRDDANMPALLTQDVPGG